MADHPFPRHDITVALSDHLLAELAQMARDGSTTQDELVRRAITGLVQARRGPEIPRFARRLGPVVPAEDGPTAA